MIGPVVLQRAPASPSRSRPARQFLLTLERAVRLEVMAQETDEKDQHQQEQPRPGQPGALRLLQQALRERRRERRSGGGAGPCLQRERSKASHDRRGGGGGCWGRWDGGVGERAARGGPRAGTLQAMSQAAAS